MLPLGVTVTLNPGTLTTDGTFAGAAPSGGLFSTFLADQTDIRISPDGDISTAPEPSTWAMMLGGAGLLVVTVRRRRARQA